MFLYRKPTERVDVTYNGLPLVDRDKLPDYIEKFNAKKTTKAEIAKLIKDGKILVGYNIPEGYMLKTEKVDKTQSQTKSSTSA